jgi:hypothetical protein
MRAPHVIAVLAGTIAICSCAPGSAQAYVDCGNPRGAAENVTASNLRCSDALIFARSVAHRQITSSQWIRLPGWRPYYAKIRRAGSLHDVRATRSDKVIRFQYGRRPSSHPICDSSYVGACLKPNVSDYDCEGGSGDGPYYTGQVEVVGDDHYDLDRDGDGIACDT